MRPRPFRPPCRLCVPVLSGPPVGGVYPSFQALLSAVCPLLSDPPVGGAGAVGELRIGDPVQVALTAVYGGGAAGKAGRSRAVSRRPAAAEYLRPLYCDESKQMVKVVS